MHPTTDPRVSYALANPIPSPDAEVDAAYHFFPEPHVSACLTVDAFHGDERPTWHLSLTLWDKHEHRPLLLVNWSPTMLRGAIALRDKLMRDVGVAEPFDRRARQDRHALAQAAQGRRNRPAAARHARGPAAADAQLAPFSFRGRPRPRLAGAACPLPPRQAGQSVPPGVTDQPRLTAADQPSTASAPCGNSSTLKVGGANSPCSPSHVNVANTGRGGGLLSSATIARGTALGDRARTGRADHSAGGGPGGPVVTAAPVLPVDEPRRRALDQVDRAVAELEEAATLAAHADGVGGNVLERPVHVLDVDPSGGAAGPAGHTLHRPLLKLLAHSSHDRCRIANRARRHLGVNQTKAATATASVSSASPSTHPIPVAPLPANAGIDTLLEGFATRCTRARASSPGSRGL
jgi:hypothetical protein